MKKILCLLVAVSLSVMVLLTGCGGTDGSSGDSEKVYQAKISVALSDEDPVGAGARYLGKILEEKSGGRIKTTVYTNKALTTGDAEQAEMVRDGTLQFSVASTFALTALNKDLAGFYIFDFPYLFDNEEDLFAYADGDINREMLDKLCELTGLRGYPQYALNWAKISTSKRDIKSPADVKGLKIRSTTSELYMAFLKACGASPTPMAYGEVYTGLSQGTIDGMMTTTPHWYYDKFYEVQKYMVSIDPFVIAHTPLVNNEWFEALPEDLQKIVDDCMYEYIDYVRGLENAQEADLKDLLRDKGMVVNDLTEAEKVEWEKIGLSIWDQCIPLVGEDFFNTVLESLGKTR